MRGGSHGNFPRGPGPGRRREEDDAARPPGPEALGTTREGKKRGGDFENRLQIPPPQPHPTAGEGAARGQYRQVAGVGTRLTGPRVLLPLKWFLAQEGRCTPPLLRRNDPEDRSYFSKLGSWRGASHLCLLQSWRQRPQRYRVLPPVLGPGIEHQGKCPLEGLCESLCNLPPPLPSRPPRPVPPPPLSRSQESTASSQRGWSLALRGLDTVA